MIPARSPLGAALAIAAVACHAAGVHAQAVTRPHSLDTVHVTSRAGGSLVADTRSVEILTRDELQRRASRSLADILGHALGLDVQQRSPAQADVGLRGSTFNQVAVLVDGVRVSDVQSGHYALDLAVPLAMIERIEILRGAGSTLYGSDAVGGVINIVTRADSSFGALGTRVGSFGGAGGSGAIARSPFGVRLRGGADVDRSSGHRPGTDYRVTQLRGSAERTVAGARATADVGLGARQFGAADFYSPYPSFETTRSSTAALRVATPLERRVALSAALHTRRHSDVFTLKREDPAFYQNRHLSWQSGVDASVRALVAPLLTTSLGAELFDARLRSARLGDHRQRRRAVFGEATLGRARTPTLNAGVRRDWSSDVGAFTSPSLGVAIPLAGVVQLRGSVGRGFRAPTWTERFYRDPANVGDSTLGVERFTARELGARFTPAAWLTADVAVFEREATGLIDWARPAGSAASTPWRTRNFASATYRGVEGVVSVPALLGIDWSVRGSGLRFDASADAGTVGKYALRPLTRTVGLSATAPFGGGRRATVDALRARRTGERDHVQLDARLDQPFGDLRLSLELLNLTNADYLDVTGKPVAPRSAFVGITWAAP